jgi:glycosyltransferase involved in cell wall biosynthesis
MEEPAPVLPEPLRAFFASHKPIVVTVGGLEPEYDVPLQVEAVERLAARHPEIGLVVIGSGRLEADLRGAIARSPHARSVLLCGDLPHTIALRAIREGDLFIRTTRYDGDSIAVREALHLGVPVIATDNGMRPDGVRLVPIASPGELERAIERTIESPEPRVPRDESGTENVEAVLELYRSLVRGASGAQEPPAR